MIITTLKRKLKLSELIWFKLLNKMIGLHDGPTILVSCNRATFFGLEDGDRKQHNSSLEYNQLLIKGIYIYNIMECN